MTPRLAAAPALVSFIIPVKNDAARLRRCLRFVAANAAGAAKIEIVVVDNGSTDDGRDVAAAAGATVLCVPDLRVSELRNRGVRAATGSILAFVDADHEVVPTWAVSAIEALEPVGVGAVGALYSGPSSGTWVQRTYAALRGRTVGAGDANWLGSGNLAVRRAAYEAVGGFDSSLEACEDVDFCQRLRAAGWRIRGDERLESVHVGDPPTLRALFRAERWRGRGNLRVSLRGPLALRDLPSLLIPLLDVAAATVAVAGIVSTPFVGLRSLPLLAGGAAVFTALAALRAVRIETNRPAHTAVGAVQAFLVALTYDLARAAALITRAPHHRRPLSNAACPVA